MSRSAFTLAMILLATTPPARCDGSAAVPGGTAAAPVDSIPAAVLEAADQGLFWRASRLLDRHLTAARDTTPPTVLLAARLAAGWGDWQRVSRLLEGRPWLDGLEGGAGWELLGRSRVALDGPAAGARALARYLELTPAADRERAVAELRRGLALAAADSTRAALAAFDRAAGLLPWFRDWAALLAAEAAAAGGDTAAVRTQLGKSGELAGGRAWRLRLRAARTAGDTMAAREVAIATARSAGSPVVRSAAWAELGTMRLAAGETARARQAFEQALEVTAGAGAVTAARNLTELGPTPPQWRRIGDIYARHGNPGRAADAYRAYLNSGSAQGVERERVRLRLGRALYNAGQYDRAERVLLDLAGEASGARIGAAALYLAGRTQYRSGRRAEGLRTLALLPERFPGQPAVTEGLYLLADLKHDDLEIDDARRYYRLAAEASPDETEAGLALMRLGGLELLEEDWAGAAEVFERYRTLHPRGRRWEQATYWAARAYAALGREPEADARLREVRARDPVSYYGMRAADLLDESILDIPMKAAPEGAAGPRVDEGLRRVDILAELGRRSDLVHEVERLREWMEADRVDAYALAEALNERGYTLTAITLGWSLYRRGDGWDPRLLRIIYPFPFRDLVVREARALGIDPYLAAGLIRQESAFSPSVRSSAGAIGLMQVMPETGRALAREVDLEGFSPALLEVPEVNVRLGTRYLAEMLERYDGRLPLVLSAYNAGPTRARVWREFPEARDDELLAERVPYAETRDYIRRVLLHRAIYRRLYPEPGAGSPDGAGGR